ncbi:MAG: hypothetical protein QOG22_458 [Pseudonocardiales bacterium]|nr:hypothetical protein [Pseudonocardiales bacterium]
MAVAAVLTLAGCTSATSRSPGPSASALPVHTLAVASPATSASAAQPSQPQPAALAGTALAGLALLLVKGRAPMTGYARSEFGDAWSDDNDAPFGHNGCDTRNDILRRDLHQTVLKSGSNGCVALSGRLDDPYTATAISFVRGSATSSRVQIDHVVALGDAWQSGAQQATAQQRQNLANDPMNLLAVDGPANQQKGAANAASWLPANTSFRCSYVARQVAVKLKYGLWVTSAEGGAIARVLSSCRGQLLTVEPGAAGPVTVRGSASASRPPPTTPAGPVVPPTSVAAYYPNCAAVRAAGRAPLHRGEPGYRAGLDRDNDGVACE